MAKNLVTPDWKRRQNNDWYARNREARKATQARYNDAHRAEINQRSVTRSKRLDVKARRNDRQRERYKTDPAFRIYTSHRVRVLRLAKCGQKARSVAVLGCSMIAFKRHIERQFKNGMTWSNHGEVWHLDHRIPCALFDMSQPNQVRQCFHFMNYQPLDRVENMRKGKRLLRDEQIPLPV